MKISVLGLGYVGLSNALLLAQHEEVMAYDILPWKIEQLKSKNTTIDDKEIVEFLGHDDIRVDFTDDFEKAVKYGEILLIATPTDYDDKTGHFDISSIEDVIEKALAIKPDSVFLVKSTIPVNCVTQLKQKFKTENIIFSPEFLREGHALYDNLHPSRIIVGEISDRGQQIADMFLRASLDSETQVLLMNEVEAEAVKLFSNTYLALRVSYFNELDTYAEMNDLDVRKIIDGMGFDQRIGSYYNNPSFGYGGYCLPKDTKQLKAEFYGVPQQMMTAIVGANETRKQHITNQILSRSPQVVGIYRLTMKANSDNFRYSAILDIIRKLEANGVQVIIFEPTLKESDFHGFPLESNFAKFEKSVDLIVANRVNEQLLPFKEKVYTRDIYFRD